MRKAKDCYQILFQSLDSMCLPDLRLQMSLFTLGAWFGADDQILQITSAAFSSVSVVLAKQNLSTLLSA